MPKAEPDAGSANDVRLKKAKADLKANLKPELLIFTATWCPQCEQVPEAVRVWKADFPQVAFRTLDINDPANAALVKKHQATSVPRLVLLRMGHVAHTQHGWTSIARYAKVLAMFTQVPD